MCDDDYLNFIECVDCSDTVLTEADAFTCLVRALYCSSMRLICRRMEPPQSTQYGERNSARGVPRLLCVSACGCGGYTYVTL